MTDSNQALILIERMRVVKNVVGGFDRPVISIHFQHLFRGGLLQT